jgi:hypothetical protein
MTKSIKLLMFIAGLIGIAVGGAMLFFPVEFQASSNIHLAGNISLLSETRAPAAALFIAGILILSGAFLSRMALFSLQLIALFYLTYGAGRLLSLLIDGIPHKFLVIAMIAEFGVGILALFSIKWYSKKHN